MLIRIRTGSRLHFGFFALPSRDSTAASEHWGGVGMMIDQPGLDLEIQLASRFSAEGPMSNRAIDYARMLLEHLRPRENLACSIRIGEGLAEHVGLGTGTQLALAVGSGLCRLLQHDLPIPDLARLLGRGRRSGIGIHGFQQGGLIIEGTKRGDGISPLLHRIDFPADWSILLVTPTGLTGTNGFQEKAAFSQLLQEAPPSPTDALTRLAFQEILPGFMEKNISRFGEGVYEFNRLAGEMFKPWQGGVYSHPRIASIIEHLRSVGISGVGQSSWGPTVFALGESDTIEKARASLDTWADVRVMLTSGRNLGFECVEQSI